MRALHLERCPPAASPIDIIPIFADRRQYAVHAEVDGDGEFTTSGISFEDYARMGTFTHKRSGQRRLETPEWALDQTKLRAVIVRYFECRAFGSGIRKHPNTGTEQQRLRKAQAKMLADKPKKLAVLDGLCREYVELKQADGDPARIRKLEQLIEGLDTAITLIDRGPAVFVAMVYLYYSLRLDSVGVAAELQCKPPAIRQSIYRMARVWEQMQAYQNPETLEIVTGVCRAKDAFDNAEVVRVKDRPSYAERRAAQLATDSKERDRVTLARSRRAEHGATRAAAA